MVHNKAVSDTFEIGVENYLACGIKFRLHVEGEAISDAETYVGYYHKGLEKSFESKKYANIIPYMSRIDNSVPFSSEYPFVLACEYLANIEVSKRASYIRTVHAEIARIINHIINIGNICNTVGMDNILSVSVKLKRQLVEIYTKTLDVRIQEGLFCLGGVRFDLSDDFVFGIKSFLNNELSCFLEEVDKVVTNNYGFKVRTKDVGFVDFDQAMSLGFSGPCLRASGCVWDLRRKTSYGVYADFDFEIPVCEAGDCYARCLVRFEEIKQSMAIINQALIKIPQGEIDVLSSGRNNKYSSILSSYDIKPNDKDEVLSCVESPKGELGVFIVSDGTDKPYRCSIRTPSLAHAGSLNMLLKGSFISDVPLIVASLDVSSANIDK
ncbi:MAG: hypothetical protein AB7U85_05735 [Alphaproteobacteria bacterium]